MKVLLKDKDFFKDILKVFMSKREIAVQIRPEYISISAYGQNNFHLTMESALFDTDIEDFTFSVNTLHLVESMDVLGGGDLVFGEGLMVVKNRSTMIIPFVPTINNEYEETDAPTTKFIVTADVAGVFGKLKGLVTYEVENNRLFIRRNAGDVTEEIEFLEIGFIMTGELKFKCNNSWTDVLEEIKSHVENIMVAFSENFLCIQFLFCKYPESYLELQIPRSLVD